MPDDKTLEYRYRFVFQDGTSREFLVRLDGRTLRSLRESKTPPPDWTRLSHHQCPNCPLTEDRHPGCPVAENLTEAIDTFKDHVSVETVGLEISNGARILAQQAKLSDAVGALMGLCMVTGGCPVLEKFKPMTRTHLPFASPQETLDRTLGAYFTAQYFRKRRGEKPDWDLQGLHSILEEVRTVNRAFCNRLRSVCPQDASMNAVIRLDCFADHSAFQIETAKLDHLEAAFDAYFEPAP